MASRVGSTNGKPTLGCDTFSSLTTCRSSVAMKEKCGKVAVVNGTAHAIRIRHGHVLAPNCSYPGVLAPAAKWRSQIVPARHRNRRGHVFPRSDGRAVRPTGGSRPPQLFLVPVDAPRLRHRCAGMSSMPWTDEDSRRDPVARSHSKDPGLSRSAVSHASDRPGRPRGRRPVGMGASAQSSPAHRMRPDEGAHFSDRVISTASVCLHP